MIEVHSKERALACANCFCFASRLAWLAMAVAVTLMVWVQPALCAAQGNSSSSSGAGLAASLRAKHLFDTAMDLMQYKQYDRGVAMLQTVIRDNPGSILGYRAHLAIGKYELDQGKYPDSLAQFLLLSRLLAPSPGKTRTSSELALYRESLFEAGLAYYQSRQYTSAFPMFRRLAEVAKNSDWANKAHYYIGMSHYNLKHWNKAIEELSLVGTEVKDQGDKVGRVEIGQRFYAKIKDADIPVMWKLGKKVQATVHVSSGDTEVLTGVPVAGKKDEALVSAPTEIGPPKPNDGILQMVGGDTLTATYIDQSTLAGKKDVKRIGKVQAVSTGSIGFYLGDYSTPAQVAYPGEPQAVVLHDADLDTSPKAQQVQVVVKSLYKESPSKAADKKDNSMLDIFAAKENGHDKWQERDEVAVTLIEQGNPPYIRTGTFVGKVKLAPVGDKPANTDDDVLSCGELDKLEVTYVDKLHVYGDEPRVDTATIKVAGSVNSGVTANQYVVFDAVLKARKNSVEAQALEGLGKIYKDMGLDDRASQKADEALKKVDAIILDRNKITSDLIEHAFKTKWECEILKGDFAAATATCEAFNRLYPQSVLADQALMTLSRGLAAQGQYDQAVAGFRRVLGLKNPVSAAEAQYLIAETLKAKIDKQFEGAAQTKWTAKGLSSKTARQEAMGPVIAAYRTTYQAYPESPYAAKAIRKVIQYYVDTNDYSDATDLLQKVFTDFPDAGFLDEMLMDWAKVAYQMNDKALAIQKLQKLIFDYPSSKYVAEAQKKLAALKAE